MSGPAILLTGLSGVGKSTALATLRGRGHRTVDIDDEGYLLERAGERSWDLPGLRRILGDPRNGPLFLAGCDDTMVGLLQEFDTVILLSAPAEVMRDRLTTRTTNRYGKTPAELDEAIGYVDTVLPLLRQIADLEIDTAQHTPDTVADLVLRHTEGIHGAAVTAGNPSDRAG